MPLPTCSVPKFRLYAYKGSVSGPLNVQQNVHVLLTTIRQLLKNELQVTSEAAWPRSHLVPSEVIAEFVIVSEEIRPVLRIFSVPAITIPAEHVVPMCLFFTKRNLPITTFGRAAPLGLDQVHSLGRAHDSVELAELSAACLLSDHRKIT